MEKTEGRQSQKEALLQALLRAMDAQEQAGVLFSPELFSISVPQARLVLGVR